LELKIKVQDGITKTNIKRVTSGVIVILLIVICYQCWQIYLDSMLPVVEIEKVKRQDVKMKISTTGNLMCSKQQDFYARTTSMVKEIRKNEGAEVTIGEVILLLDNSNALLELGKAENTLAVMQKDYLQAVSDKVLLMRRRDDARKNLERTEGLYNLGVAALTEVQDIKLRIADIENQILSINLSVLESQLTKGELDVQVAREQLAATVITSPFDGTVLKMSVKCGQPVGKGDFLFSVGKTNSLETIVSVNEYDALKIQDGQPVEIYSEAIEGEIYSGHVFHVAPQAEKEQTDKGSENKVKLKIALDDKAIALKPGYTINVDILLENKENILVIPQTAVVERDGRKVIFVYEDGFIHIREVQLSTIDEMFQEVTSNLKEGEMYVISPSDSMQDNVAVKI